MEITSWFRNLLNMTQLGGINLALTPQWLMKKLGKSEQGYLLSLEILCLTLSIQSQNANLTSI